MRTQFRSRLAAGLAAAGLAATGLLISAPARAADTTPCSPLQLVIARGTFEFGTYGFIVGDNLVPEVRAKIPAVGAHAVNYPASVDAASPAAGVKAIVDHVTARAAACPNERYVLVGYSQGAQIVDMALGVDTTGTINGGPPATTIPAALTSRIASVVLFGNPIRSIGKTLPPQYAGRTADYCTGGDPVCEPNAINFIAHLLYAANGDVSRAATFIASHR